MFSRSWPPMETTEPGIWSIARAVRVAVTTTWGVYSTSSSLAALSGTSAAGSAAAEKAGAAAIRPTATVPAAINTKRSLDEVVTLLFSPALFDRYTNFKVFGIVFLLPLEQFVER